MVKGNKSQSTIAYKNRIKETVDTIYNLVSAAATRDGFAQYKKSALFTKCGSALRSLGLVHNAGTTNRPVYSWKGDTGPDKATYQKVYKILHARNVANWQKASTKAEDEFKQVLSTMPAAPASMPVARTALVLVNFTDKQLWDELKSRNYHIEDNRLVKQIYLD